VRRSAACRKFLHLFPLIYFFSLVLVVMRLPSGVQIYMSEATTTIVGPGGDYLPDRAVSDLDDPDLGAAALADNATGGGGGAGGSEAGGGVETWPDDDEDEDEPHPARSSATTGAGPSSGPSARGSKRKRKQGAALFGSTLKKPKNPAAVTRRKEAVPRWRSIRGSRTCPSWCQRKYPFQAFCLLTNPS